MKRNLIVLRTLAVFLSLALGLPAAVHPGLVEGYALRQAGLEENSAHDDFLKAIGHWAPAAGAEEVAAQRPETGLEEDVKEAVVGVLQVLRKDLLNLDDASFLLSLYRDESYETTEEEQRVIIPRVALFESALASSIKFPPVVPEAVQRKILERLNLEAYPFLPRQINMPVKIHLVRFDGRPLAPKEIADYKKEIIEANVVRSLPIIRIHDAINGIIRSVDPNAKVELSKEEKVALVVRLHADSYQRIHSVRGDELFRPGHYIYTQSNDVVMRKIIQKLEQSGYFKPGTTLGDLGFGDNFVSDLFCIRFHCCPNV